MPVRDELGKRMKENYEQIAQTKLMRRTPVAIRIDGKAFHTFTYGLRKPFDEILATTMQETMRYLCENIQGCVLGYTQSDEITLILQDYATLETDAWFGYKVQKICSVAASMATYYFNHRFMIKVADYIDSIMALQDCDIEEEKKYMDALRVSRNKGAFFDARCFNIPKEEVTNLIYWRQLDARRNAVQAIGQCVFSQKELQNKSCNEIIAMLGEKKIFVQDFKSEYINGSCCVKKPSDVIIDGVQRSVWTIDKEIPLFGRENRDYIEKLINFEEEK